MAYAQSATPTHVLDLDGTNSFVELPPRLFTNQIVTVEGWVNWREFGFYSRFFEFADAALMLGVLNMADTSQLAVQRYRTSTFDDQIQEGAPPDFLVPGQWRHVAVVAGTNFSKLYVNGALVSTETSRSQWKPPRLPELKNFLGRSAVKEVLRPGENPDFNGQMAEVRLWAGERNATEIQTNVFRKLTGREPGLLALWNFADGTAKDSSPHGRDGRLGGAAKVVEETLPPPANVHPWSQLKVKLTDSEGVLRDGVTLRALVNGIEVGRRTNLWNDVYPLVLLTSGESVDLEATGARGLGGWRVGVPLIHHGERTVEWLLRPAIHIAGRVQALDGKTPLGSVVVELVEPEREIAGFGDRTLTPALSRRMGEGARRAGEGATAIATNGVLNLPGDGSYATLPENILAGLTQATIEGWAKWSGKQPPLKDYEIVFGFGTQRASVWVGSNDRSTLQAGFEFGELRTVTAPGAIHPDEWFHWALVIGSGQIKLYVNGRLASSKEEVADIASVEKGENLLGRNIYKPGNPSGFNDLAGQMDDLRIWSVARSEAQIRDNLRAKLTGLEPGLVGYWNFDDPAQPMRDRSTNGFHGHVFGAASVTNVQMAPLLFGKITDVTGKPLGGATVTVHQRGQTDRTANAGQTGEYVAVPASSSPCDVFITNAELSAYQLEVQLTGEPMQRLDCTLADPEKAPVILGHSSRDDEAPANSEFGIRNSEFKPSLVTSAAMNFPAGTVVAAMLTDEQGNFKFPNVKPGRYQVRAQIPGGRAWLDAGKILYAAEDLSDGERTRLANLDFHLAPFRKMQSRQYTVLQGLPEIFLGNHCAGTVSFRRNVASQPSLSTDPHRAIDILYQCPHAIHRQSI